MQKISRQQIVLNRLHLHRPGFRQRFRCRFLFTDSSFLILSFFSVLLINVLSRMPGFEPGGAINPNLFA
jgi:hypothetical protein